MFNHVFVTPRTCYGGKDIVFYYIIKIYIVQNGYKRSH